MPAARTSAQSLYTTAVGVVELGVAGLGDVGLGVVGLGVVELGAVGLGVAGLDVVVAGFAGAGVVEVGFDGVVFARVVGGTGVLDRLGPESGPDHGGAGALGVGVGRVDGNHGVVTGSNGFPTGRDGRLPDRVVPEVRSTCGLNKVVLGGAWVVAESCERDGTKNNMAASATTTAASAPSFRSGRRRRLCRGPELRICRARRNCVTCEPFTPRPRGSLPTRSHYRTHRAPKPAHHPPFTTEATVPMRGMCHRL